MEQNYITMESKNEFQTGDDRPSTTPSPDGSNPNHRRSVSGSLLSKLSFLRASSDGAADRAPLSPEFAPGDDRISSKKTSRAMAAAVQQQKTRRRKGSLRKAALLGRGAQREKREMKASPLDTGYEMSYASDATLSPTSPEEIALASGYGLGISEATPRPSMEGYASRANNVLLPPPVTMLPMGTEDRVISPPPSATSPTLTYTSTDEDDVLSIPNHSLPPPPRIPSTSSGSDSYFPPGAGSLARRRSHKAKSPLSLGGPAASPLPAPDAEWDYSETEWWGWVVLIVTWIVFVTGMGSCLGVWSWAWDVGETPYAPPELEDDPTLPIVGYYPALIILTAVMAWVWVVVAWVGMKYFRHAKISGD